MEATEKSLTEKLDNIIEKIETIDKKKKFNLPLGIKLQQGRIKKNYAIAQIIRTNGTVNFKMLPIEDNTIKIGEVYHEATAKYILRYKKYPMIIVPEWNITPINKPEDQVFVPEKDLKEAIEEGKLSAAEKFILHAIKMDLVKQKPKIKTGTILIIIAIIVGGLYLLNSQGYI
jgi:hypothetical protein